MGTQHCSSGPVYEILQPAIPATSVQDGFYQVNQKLAFDVKGAGRIVVDVLEARGPGITGFRSDFVLFRLPFS